MSPEVGDMLEKEWEAGSHLNSKIFKWLFLMLQEFWQILNKKEDLVKLEDAKAPLEDPLGLAGF